MNLDIYKRNRIVRNKTTHTPILLRRNKTLDKLNLEEIGSNNNSRLITNYNTNNINTNKYNIKNINRINSINIINKINNNINNDNIGSNSVKYSTTSGGSIVSIHNNKIHGLPILQGVCPRCINSELIILKELNKKINKFSSIYENYDMLENEKQRDKELKDRILLKVKYNKNRLYTENINNEKNKLIEKNSNAECKLFKPVGDPIKDRVMDKYLKKEEYFKNKKLIPYNINLDADKYLKNNNYITKFSVPSIGMQQYKNKYLPTMEQYIKSLSNQINDKKIEEEKEKQKEKENSKNNTKDNKDNKDGTKKDFGFNQDKSKINNMKYKIKNRYKRKIKYNKDLKIKNKKKNNAFKSHDINNNGFLKYLNHLKNDRNYLGKSNNYRGIRYGKNCDIYDYLLIPKESEKIDEALNKDFTEFKSVNQ